MDCPACSAANPDGARFCGSCGASLATTAPCPSCGTENAADQRFCHGCGRALGAPDPAVRQARDPRPYVPPRLADKIRDARAELEGERKQVTVLFADVMGSMELAEYTDPEDWRQVMDRLFAILCEGVHRFEGTVDKFTGDGAMALFGAPIAHEDHAQRACFAALSLGDELAAYATELRRTQGLNLAIRMGINSGEVVVGAIGDDLSVEYTAIGHTVGLAQRMESLAEPGRAYVTDATARLVAGFVELRDLGEFDVKGASAPMRLHELVGAGVARSRLDVSRARGFSRFVGRDDELATLEAALDSARAGHGAVVGVVGEPGVGKSRLCHEFAERCRAEGIPVYAAQGQAHAKAIPLLPVLQMMRDFLGVSERDSDLGAREKIAGRLLLLDAAFADELPLLFDFLAVPDPERPAPRMDPDARQRALLGLIRRMVHASSRREPAVNMLEDLHWVDAGSQVFLTQLVESVAGTRSLVLVNFRPEYRAEWMSKSYYRQVSLLPLGPEATDALLAELLGTDPSLNGLSELIRERTGGNPFFVEELVRMLVEEGRLDGSRGAYRLLRPVEHDAVPATVQTVLAARIDRLAEHDRQVLRAAAVIGVEFAQPVLARVVELTGDELEAALHGLVAVELVYERELYPEAVYAFKHPLTREVAYGSQLGERRAAVHRRAAQALAELYAERLDERAGVIAHHWEAAGEAFEGARWHARAAAWSGLSDIAAAVSGWRKVAELASAAPESPEATALAVASRMWRLGYGWRLGISEHEAQVLYEDGCRLADQAGDVTSLILIKAVYTNVRGMSGHPGEAVALGEQTLALAEQTGSPALRLAARPFALYAHFMRGRFEAALRLADEGIELANDDPTLGAGLGVDYPAAMMPMMRALALTWMGRLEEAEAADDQALALARELGSEEIEGWTHMGFAWLWRYAQRPDRILAPAMRSHEIAERIGDTFSRGWALTALGLAHRAREDWTEAITTMEAAIELTREHRTALEGESWRLAILAEALIGAGDAAGALQRAEESVTLTLQRRSDYTLAYCQRARAETLAAAGAPVRDVEQALDEAEATARRTGSLADLPLIGRARATLIVA